MANPVDLVKEGPIGEQTLSFLSKSKSAPNTPRPIEEIVLVTSQIEQFQMNGEELSKEMQIAMLKERLDFTEKQLLEKDRQLEHYKQLVKTLKEVLAEVSGRRYNPASIRPPPGFEQQNLQAQKFPIQGRRVRSFHNEHYQPEEEEDDPFDNNKKEKYATSWRKPPEEQTVAFDTKKESPIRENTAASKQTQNHVYKISKSVSQTALSSLTDESQLASFSRDILRSSAPIVQKQSIEQVVGNSSTPKKPGALKKVSIYDIGVQCFGGK